MAARLIPARFSRSHVPEVEPSAEVSMDLIQQDAMRHQHDPAGRHHKVISRYPTARKRGVKHSLPGRKWRLPWKRLADFSASANRVCLAARLIPRRPQQSLPVEADGTVLGALEPIPAGIMEV